MLRWLVVVCVVGAFSGCFNPRVKNLGFACAASDVNPCPAGFRCLNGYCDDGSGGAAPGGGVGGNGGGADMTRAEPMNDLSAPAMQSMDLARPQPTTDLAQPATV